jgi:hypothetical protein
MCSKARKCACANPANVRHLEMFLLHVFQPYVVFTHGSTFDSALNTHYKSVFFRLEDATFLHLGVKVMT